MGENIPSVPSMNFQRGWGWRLGIGYGQNIEQLVPKITYVSLVDTETSRLPAGILSKIKFMLDLYRPNDSCRVDIGPI